MLYYNHFLYFTQTILIARKIAKKGKKWLKFVIGSESKISKIYKRNLKTKLFQEFFLQNTDKSINLLNNLPRKIEFFYELTKIDNIGPKSTSQNIDVNC